MGRARWATVLVVAALALGVGMTPRAAEAVEVSVPAISNVFAGETASVSVTVDDAEGIASADITLTFDPDVIHITGMTVNPLLDGPSSLVVEGGTATISLHANVPIGPILMPVPLCSLDVQAVGAAGTQSPLAFTACVLQNSVPKTILSTTKDGYVKVVEAEPQPPWYDFGTVYQGAIVEGSFALRYVKDIVSVTKPDWITIRRQDENKVYSWGWASLVYFAVDTTAVGPLSGEIAFETDAGALTFAVEADVRDPAEAASRLLVISAPFGWSSTGNPATFQPFLDIVASTHVNADYIEAAAGIPGAVLPADLLPYDAILISGNYLSQVPDASPDVARLVAFARDNAGRRLIVCASHFWSGLVTKANVLLSPFGLNMLDEEASEYAPILTGEDIGTDPFTAGVDQVTLLRPSPIEVGSHTILLRDLENAARAYAAVSRGTSEVIGLGTALWWSDLYQYGEAPNDNVRFFSNLIAFAPIADFGATPTRGIAPLNVHFTDLSTNGPTAWSWDYGDGGASTDQNPWHGYTSPGRYTVSLTATNGYGPDTETKARLVLVSFPDVPVDPEHWALEPILACVDAGIVSGYPDGTYGPLLPVTRDQMAVYISRALAGGGVPDGPTLASFPDVPTTHWAFKYVEYAKSLNIVSGYPDGTYQPGNSVDRGQMAVYISRAMADPTGDEGLASYTPPATPSFPDVPTDFWSYKYVEYAKSHGVVSGYPDGSYQPAVVVTRDQMAVYVARAFGLM